MAQLSRDLLIKIDNRMALMGTDPPITITCKERQQRVVNRLMVHLLFERGMLLPDRLTYNMLRVVCC